MTTLSPADYMTELPGDLDLARLNRQGPICFQDELYGFVRTIKPEIIVETGTRKGVSTTFLLEACRMNELGHVYSCDPIYYGQEAAALAIKKALGYEPDPDAWTFTAGKSDKMLRDWTTVDVDLFIHDSDHSAKNMAFELRWAIAYVRPGGYIIVDDWEQKKHTVFADWAAEHGLTPRKFGRTAALVQVPSERAA